MALLQECPNCKNRSDESTKKCKCGFTLAKARGKVYWIEYYLLGKRTRERIGPNKLAAEQRLREVLKARTEERYIDKNKNARITFDDLAKWYLNLPQIKTKSSYSRNVLSIRTISRILSGKVVRDLTLNHIEAYRQKRLGENSYKGEKTCPATVNREISCLGHIMNLAEREGLIESVPFKGLKNLKEDNVRTKILSHEEYDRLLSCCPPHTAKIIRMDYYTAMRQGEILNLIWDKVDLKNEFIHLEKEDTKPRNAGPFPCILN